LAQRLVNAGQLRELARGLYLAPARSRFGEVPPSDETLMQAFLDTDHFVITGPPAWNTLGLGTTAMFAATLVYNTKRSGEFVLAGRRFLLRRVAFPARPTREWFAVDLIEHRAMAGADTDKVTTGLVRELRAGRLSADALADAAARYGTLATVDIVRRCIVAARRAA
jgi:hypothetical protein